MGRKLEVAKLNDASQKPKTFEFDFVFDSSIDPQRKSFATQERVFQHLGEDMLLEALEGRNVSILAYGQTGSGKSHTMFGSPDDESDLGLIPRAIERLFHMLDEMKLSSGCGKLRLVDELFHLRNIFEWHIRPF